MITLDVMNAKVIGHAQPRDEFFIGYENMGYDASSLLLQGLSPTATKNGEGAYQFGSLDPSSGLYSPKDNIPFKEITGFFPLFLPLLFLPSSSSLSLLSSPFLFSFRFFAFAFLFADHLLHFNI